MSSGNFKEDLPCCDNYHKGCKYLSTCIRIECFWKNELLDPSDDQNFEVGDLVILNTTCDYADPEFYGLVIKTTASVVTTFTPAKTINRQPTSRILKVRITPISSPWRNDLLLSALRSNAIKFNDSSETEPDDLGKLRPF